MFKRALTHQWSFFWAGIVFGIAQIIYIIGDWAAAAKAGKPWESTPITVTTDLGRMFRATEMWVTDMLGIADFQIYGASVKEVASGGAFVPGIGWPIVGMLLGGMLVAWVERESRTWVRYPAHVLWVSFFGGVVFSYGTRLAGGCTLNHLLGGIPLMNIHSTVTVIFMAIGGAVAFYLLGRVQMAPYFKHQETRAYVVGNDPGESATYDPKYRPRRRPMFWAALLFLVVFFGVSVYGGLFDPESLQHLKKGKLVAFVKSVDDKGWFYVIATLLSGVVAGFAMAKSGFGTECAVVSAEAGGMMKKHDSFYAALGVPRITRTLMRGYIPVIGIMASWVVLLGFVIVAWVFAGIKPGFESGLKEQLTEGNIVGGVLLGAGAVMLIGCEVRSYMRIGLGYLNTWVGFMGFAVGYLPWTLYLKQHEAYLQAGQLAETYKWYQLVSGNTGVQQLVLFLWWVVLLVGLVLVIRAGTRQTGVSRTSLIQKSTEDLQVEIDEKGRAGGGRIGEVGVPMLVPRAG